MSAFLYGQLMTYELHSLRCCFRILVNSNWMLALSQALCSRVRTHCGTKQARCFVIYSLVDDRNLKLQMLCRRHKDAMWWITVTWVNLGDQEGLRQFFEALQSQLNFFGTQTGSLILLALLMLHWSHSSSWAN